MLFFFLPQLQATAIKFTAIDWPEIEFPEEAEISIVAPYLIQNGLPTRIYKFKVALDLEKTGIFFYEQWQVRIKNSDLTPMVYPQEDNMVVSVFDKPFMITAQFKKVSKEVLEGYVTLSNLIPMSVDASRKQKKYKKGAGFPIPSQTEVVTETWSQEQFGTSRTMMMLSKRSIKGLMNYFRTQYFSKGYHEQKMPDSKSGAVGVLVFQKGKDEVHITLTPGPSKSKSRKVTSVVSVEVNRT